MLKIRCIKFNKYEKYVREGGDEDCMQEDGGHQNINIGSLSNKNKNIIAMDW